MTVSVYRFLLRLYPASFRAEYEAELMRAHLESTRGQHGVFAILAAIGDIVPNAVSAHASILRQDLLYAARTLNRSRGFATTAVLVTALGVGANTATFSVADAVLLRPLPFRNPADLVRLCEGPKEGGGWGCMNELSPANFRDAAAMATRTRDWGAFTGNELNLVGFGEPAHIRGTSVTRSVFSTLGVRPLMGRVFEADRNDGDEGSVVLSYGLWQSQFGGDAGVVGKTIRLDDTPRVVVGVMPSGFHFPTPDDQIWTPLILREDDYAERDNTYLQAVGRLAPGATFEQARAEFAAIASRLAREYPATNEQTGFSFFRQRDVVAPRYRIMLLALCGASLALLLLTGANLGNLLLVRAASRERELAVRAALGAGRERLVRQMFTESLLLAMMGGLAGVLVAMLAVPLLSHLVPTTLPLADPPRVDLRALGIAAAFAAATGIGFGLIPAGLVRRTGFTALRDGNRGGGGRRQRLRTILVTTEVAVSVVLLVTSGLLIRAVWKVQAVDPGFMAERVLTLRTALPPLLSADSVRRTAFYDRVLAGVQSIPGVTAAAYTSGLPMRLTGGIAGVEIPGAELRNRRRNGVSLRYVTPQFFATLGIPVVRGRAIGSEDRIARPRVAVVSESFVRELWPNDDPIGKPFKVRGLEPTVVGIVRDIKVRGLERSNEPQLYMAAAQAPSQLGGLYIPKDLMIRTTNRPDALLPTVRDVIRRVDPDQPISDVTLLSDVVGRQTADRHAQLRILTALAVVALLLTGIGIHGLLAFMVAQRSREIGVRLALGAEPAKVARMIVAEATRLALYGSIPGLALAYAAARAMNALLFGIPPGDPYALMSGTALVVAVTLIGAIVPAYRAVQVSPLVAMRAE